MLQTSLSLLTFLIEDYNRQNSSANHVFFLSGVLQNGTGNIDRLPHFMF